MSTAISPAEDADVHELVALINSAYRGESSRAGWTTEADLVGGQRTDAETLRDDIRSGTILCLREEAGGPIRACVYLRDKPGGDCYLGMLTVEPMRQASGFGRTLLDYSEQYVRAQRMVMRVISTRTELIAWYERRGYTRTGETQPFPYGDTKFGEPKVDGLRFILLAKQLAQ